MSRAADVRALRPAQPAVDPWRPLDWSVEDEREPDGTLRPAVTVFLAGAECPFTCVYCDLWRFTLAGPTPPGALPAQLRIALDELGSLPSDARIKLYNASNFFDPRAVPPEDNAALAALVEPFSRVTVECHPKLIGRRCFDFAERLRGRLEVAVGLETVHPEALPRLGKGLRLDDFDRAAERLRKAGVGLRCFVLVGAPHVPRSEDAEWAARSARRAWAAGAERVVLIPVRGGNGYLDRLAEEGRWTGPTLADLEDALDRCLDDADASGGVVAADLWDLELFSSCRLCFDPRRERLAKINRTGRWEPRIGCDVCRHGRPTAQDQARVSPASKPSAKIAPAPAGTTPVKSP